MRLHTELDDVHLSAVFRGIEIDDFVGGPGPDAEPNAPTDRGTQFRGTRLLDQLNSGQGPRWVTNLYPVVR